MLNAKKDGERAAFANRTFHMDGTAVNLDDVLDDGEAQPGAAELAAAGGIDAVEALEEPVEVLAFDSEPFVFNEDGHLPRRGFNP